MKTRLALLLALVLGTAQLAACAAPAGEAVSPGTETNVNLEGVEQNAEPNFRLLVSDEPNDIGDFEELWVTISGIGFVQGDEECVIEEVIEPPIEVNLVELQGEDAVMPWEGYIPEGDYTKIFLYVDTTVTGVLVEGGEEIEIKLPSNKLQLKLPFTVGDEPEGEAAEFVFDITVHSAGNSGQYILKPQLTESGEGQQYRILEHTEERIRTGKPEWAGNPEDAGKPETAGTGAQGGPPADAGKPDDGGQRVATGTPAWAAIPGENGASKSNTTNTE